MSHEIRTPMNGVLGLVELLSYTPLSKDQQRTLRQIRDSASALLQILNDILDFSKIEAGRLQIEATPMSLRDVAESVVNTLAAQAHEKGIDIRLQVDAATAATLEGDSARWRQILFNLVGNAIKFTRQGWVWIRIEVVEQRAEGQAIRLTVADTGIGIEPRLQARAIQPFSQAEASTTRRFGGTGLGLAICRRLADAMGGSIELESEPDHGTRVSYTQWLPVITGAEVDPELAGTCAAVFADYDDPGRAVAEALSAIGMEVRHLSFQQMSTEADELTACAEVDLVLIDPDHCANNDRCASVSIEELVGRSQRKPVLLTNRRSLSGTIHQHRSIEVSCNPLQGSALHHVVRVTLGLENRGEAVQGESAPEASPAEPEHREDTGRGRPSDQPGSSPPAIGYSRLQRGYRGRRSAGAGGMGAGSLRLDPHGLPYAGAGRL